MYKLLLGLVLNLLFCAYLLRADGGSPGGSAQTDTGSTSPFHKGVALSNYGKLPLSFEANAGQADKQVKFLLRGRGYTLFLTGEEAVIALKRAAPQSPKTKGLLGRNLAEPQKQTTAASTVLRMQLAGANAAPRVVGAGELPGKANYFIANNPSRWRTNVPTYAEVKYPDVYPGVNLVYHGNQGQLEYDFVVEPGGDTNRIQLKFCGAGKLRVDEKGNLLLGAAGNEVRFQKPVVYQTTDGVRKSVEGNYVLLSSNLLGFQLGNYDHSQPLVIDPVLVYATYLGGSGSDFSQGIAVDAAGSAYITGNTSSANFPTAKPLQSTLAGGTNAFVTKINASGTAMVYSTYLGGSNGDSGDDIAVDAAGSAYITGNTSSSNFPTVKALQSTLAGATNAFVTKINASGTALVYSTYLGGSYIDSGFGIAVDAAGNAYMTGFTASSNFPTVRALQPAPGAIGAANAFVSKINAAGSALVYSTYLGGSGEDQGSRIAVDTAGNAYVTGDTTSTNFPTANALQSTLAGFKNVFVTKINASGTALVYSTYLGGSFDFGNGIAVDASGNAYVTGTTNSLNFPTANALQPTYGGGSDAFVSKINAVGTTLVYSTYLGGSNADGGSGIAVDVSGNAYVTGFTASTNFPTANALQPTYGAGSPDDAFISKINAAGSALIYSTYLGGSADVANSNIAVDASGNAYVTAFTASTNFPTTNALQSSLGGNGANNALVAKIAPDARSIKESVLSQLEGLLHGSAKYHGEKELREAIRHLSNSLSPQLWAQDGNHVKPRWGREVFEEEEEAVTELTGLIHEKRTTISAEILQGYISNLVEADRILASIAITEGEPEYVASAKKHLAEGDENAALGRSREEIRDYEEAWVLVSALNKK